MKLTVLGCLGAYPYEGQGTSSYLLQADGFNLLLDAGSSTLVELEKELDPLDLDAVILSHYHHDHIADLGVPAILLAAVSNTNTKAYFADLWTYGR